MQILIAHQQVEFREAVRSRLVDALKARFPRLVFDDARNEVEALQKIERQRNDAYNVMIAAWELPYDSSATPEQSGGGIHLLSVLPTFGHSRTKCFVIGPPGLQQVIGIGMGNIECSFLETGPSLFDELARLVGNELVGYRPQPKFSVVFRQDPGSQNWNFWMGGGADFPVNLHGAIPVTAGIMRMLTEHSDLAERTADWLHELAVIGDALRENIFERNELFLNMFKVAVRIAGGIDKARFAFDVNQQMYPLMLEALVGPEPEAPIGWAAAGLDPSTVEFWMLRAPIYRSLSVPDSAYTYGHGRTPLFEHDRTPFNCLIIEAEASGDATIPEGNLYLPPLTNVKTECDWLESHLRTNRRRIGVNEIRRISLESLPPGKTFKQELQETLETGSWQLVHFAGHSAYSREKGYLFLPGSEIQVLDAKYFASWLSSAQLLFLSSCHSSTATFVRDMARMNVPAVIGFRWDIDDRMAEDYAACFYENLFRYRSIETAFVEARKAARDHHGHNARIWAAPMLILLEAPRRGALAAA